MERKKLKELDLMDNFLFWTMVSYPGIGEEFVRRILETAFERKFGELSVIPEKGYPGSDTDLHGARLDVYVEGLVETKEPLDEEDTGTLQEAGGPADAKGTAGISGEASMSESKAKPAGKNGGAGQKPVTGRAVIYDLEPDNNAEKREYLPKRVRFYHAKIDTFSLQSGEDYRSERSERCAA